MTVDAELSFLEQLFAADLLIPSGVDGLYGRSGVFEGVVDGLEAMITRLGAHQNAEVMRFPPGSPRTTFEKSGYLKGFPHLAGTVHCFCGNERDHRELLRRLEAGEDWTSKQAVSEIVLSPAACYPVYPALAARGALRSDAKVIDVLSYCFRHEPSIEPTRMQMFRQREYVCVGTEARVLAFRQEWIDRVDELKAGLALPTDVDVANDPFFGRAGKIMAESQREQALKFELLIPVNDKAAPTACVSFNCHLDHFGQTWNLRTPDGAVAHSACVGFGLERLTLALFRHHGMTPADWPVSVRNFLRPL